MKNIYVFYQNKHLSIFKTNAFQLSLWKFWMVRLIYQVAAYFFFDIPTQDVKQMGIILKPFYGFNLESGVKRPSFFYCKHKYMLNEAFLCFTSCKYSLKFKRLFLNRFQ